MWHRLKLPVMLVSIFAASLSFVAAAGIPGVPDTSDQTAIQEAANWVGRSGKIQTEYRYVMTCKVRLLFFWGGT